MPKTSEWKEKAEAEYKREKEDVEADGKAIFALYVFYLIILVILFGTIYFVKWMIVGGNFLPHSWSDAAWGIVAVFGFLPISYLVERRDKAKEIREQRLIRLEMKIDTVLDGQKRIEDVLQLQRRREF
jgi:hypothetical protein